MRPSEIPTSELDNRPMSRPLGMRYTGGYAVSRRVSAQSCGLVWSSGHAGGNAPRNGDPPDRGVLRLGHLGGKQTGAAQAPAPARRVSDETGGAGVCFSPRVQPSHAVRTPTGRRLLLHVCCAPCAAHAVERVRAEGWAVTLFFANSNIAPSDEYERRLDTARDLARRCACVLLVDTYDHDAWLAAVRGLEDEPEKGRRCLVCFRFSLERTAQRAAADGFDGFATTLTISPHKRSADILRIGADLERFVALDFKKQDGFRRSTELAREYGLYRQNTCGCEFSADAGAPPRLADDAKSG